MADASVTFDILARVRGERQVAKLALETEILRRRLKKLDEQNVKSAASSKRLEKALGAASGGMSGLVTTAVALGPALLPVLASATAGTMALGSSLAGAGAALGVFGAVAKSSFGQVQTQVQLVTKAQQKLTEATNSKQRTAATKQLADARAKLAGLKGPLGEAARGYAGMTSAWSSFVKANQGPTFKILGQGFAILGQVIPKLQPLFTAGATAIQSFLAPIKKAVSGGGFDSFVKFLAAQAGPALQTFGAATWDVIRTVGNLMKAFAPLSGSVLGGIRGMAKGMADWSASLSKSQGFHAFMDYVRKTGPLVADTLRKIWHAAVNITAGLAPLGPVALQAVNGLAGFVGAIDPSKIGASAAAFVAVAIGMKAVAAAEVAVKAAMALGPWGLLAVAVVAAGAALIYLNRNTKPVQAAWSALKGFVTGSLLPALQRFGGYIMGGLRSAWHSISAAVQRNRPQLEQWGRVLMAAGKIIVTQVIPVLGKLAGVYLKMVGHQIALVIDVIGKMTPVFMTMMRVGIKAFLALLYGIDGVARVGSHLPGKMGAMFRAIHQGAQGAINAMHGLQDAINGVHGKKVNVYVYTWQKTKSGRKYKDVNAATGGFISGPGSGTSDSIPAMLSNGEFVMNAAATARNRGTLEAMNAQHFASGGLVHMARGGRAHHKAKHHDPYRLGLGTVSSIVRGLTGSEPQVRAAADHLADTIRKAFEGRKEKRLVAAIKRHVAPLVHLIHVRDAAAARFKVKSSHLAGLVSARNELASGVTSSAIGTGNIAGLGDGASVLDRLNRTGGATAAFQSNLSTLAHRHLASGLLRQLADAGLGEGSSTAAGLVSSGNIGAINAAFGRLTHESNRLGATAGNAVYGRGIGADQREIAELRHELASVQSKIGREVKLIFHVPPTANKAEIGKEVVAAIKEYEKRSGKGWRN